MVDDDLAALRATARARATALGLPTAAAEDWRHVRCQPLAAAPATAARTPTAAELAPWIPAGPALVLVDSAVAGLHGVWPAAWRLRLPTGGETAALHALAAEAVDAPACWPFADGACTQVLEVDGAHEQPLTVVSCTTGGSSGWHLRLDLDAGSALTLALVHVQLAPARSSQLVEAVLGRGARLTVDEVQAGAAEQLLGHVRLELAEGAEAAWTAAGRGGALVRQRLDARLGGPRAALRLAAVDVTHGAAQAHRLTRVTHQAAHTVSDQLIKAVLHDASLAGCDGCVTMLPGAEGSEAELQNRNLLLSAEARADTRPQLDIRVDDVKAAHGATVGQLSAEELLYLRMRGLDAAAAAALLTRGHLEEVVGRMAVPAMRDLARRTLGLAP